MCISESRQHAGYTHDPWQLMAELGDPDITVEVTVKSN